MGNERNTTNQMEKQLYKKNEKTITSPKVKIKQTYQIQSTSHNQIFLEELLEGGCVPGYDISSE